MILNHVCLSLSLWLNNDKTQENAAMFVYAALISKKVVAENLDVAAFSSKRIDYIQAHWRRDYTLGKIFYLINISDIARGFNKDKYFKEGFNGG